MKRNIKTIFAVILSLVLVVLSFATMPQVDSSKSVHDLGNFLSPEEEQLLEEKASEMRSRYNMPVIVATTDDSLGRTTQNFVEDFYRNNNFAEQNDLTGMMLLIDMDSRNIDVRTFGALDSILSDVDIDDILDDTVEYMRGDSNIYLAADEFLNQSDAKLKPWTASVLDRESGVPVTNYQSSDYVSPDNKLADIRNSFLIGIFVAAVVIIILYTIHRTTLPGSVSAVQYMDRNKMNYQVRTDNFVNTRTTKIRIAQNNNNSGGGFVGGGGWGSGGSSGGSRSFGGSSGGGGGGGGARGGSRGF